MAISIGTVGSDLKVDLQTSAAKFRKELIKLPIIGCSSTIDHMTIRPGLRANETVGQIGGTMQYGPYSSTYKDNSNITINPRTLEVFMGSVIKDFDPNQVAASIYGSSVTKGDGLKNTDIAQMIVAYLMKQLGGNLNKVIWSASRNGDGHTSATLFNGFDTITTAEKTAATTIYNTAVAALAEGSSAAQKAAAGNAAVLAAGTGIHSSLGNYTELSEALSSSNAVDIIQGFVQDAAPELQGLELNEQDPVKLFVPYSVYNLYNQAYQKVVGPVVYNTGYTKRMVEGTNVELVPLVNKTGSDYITLSTKSNMLIGCNLLGEEEQIQIDRFSSFVLTLSATMFFGTQFESINKERLFIGKLHA